MCRYHSKNMEVEIKIITSDLFFWKLPLLELFNFYYNTM